MRPWNDYQEKECVVLQCLVNPRDIGYICCIVESYEGLAIVSTIDENKGLLHLYCTVDMRDEFMEFIAQLKKEIRIRILAEKHMNKEQMNAIEYSTGKQHPRPRDVPNT